MLKVCVLTGGSSSERDISIISSKEIIKNLNKEKYEIMVLDIPADKSTGWIRVLLDNPPDIVLSGLHGGLGENGSVQGLLECMNIPYVGSKVLSSAVCLNKFISKTIMRSFHIPVAEDMLIKDFSQLLLNEDIIHNELGFPLIVKPNSGGSSIGISIAHNIEQLETAVKEVLNMGDDALVEQYIKGQEVSCGIIEDEKGLSVLPVLEIRSDKMFFEYNDKYFKENENAEFSGLPDFLKTMIQEIAKKAFSVLECSGYGRLDMIVHEEQVTVIEINTLPGLTNQSLIPKAAMDSEGGFSGFLDKLIEFEYKRSNEKDFTGQLGVWK